MVRSKEARKKKRKKRKKTSLVSEEGSRKL
jgi:hypothetical protein